MADKLNASRMQKVIFFRVILALASLGILAWQLVRMKTLLSAVKSTTSVPAVPYNDAVQKGIELLVDQSGTWAQATVVLLGTLVALWIAKGDESGLAFRVELWPEICIWLAGAFMLGAGLYCHNEYLDSIVTALEVGGLTSDATIKIPNVFDEKYEAVRSEQFRLLIFGTAASAVAILSVRKHKQSGGADG